MSNQSKTPRRHTAFKAAACVSTLAVMLALATSARAQYYDNFNSGTLDPAHWSTITSPFFPITYSFPPDALGGSALRMQCSAPPGATANNGYTTARVVAVNTDNSYTDFYVAADLVAINPSVNTATNYGFTGLMARETGEVASGTNFSGVGMMYWNNLTTQSSPPLGIGAIAMGYFVKGSMSFLFPNPAAGVVPSAVAYWTLQTNHIYRLVFQGVGPNLTGSVYDTLDLTQPLGTIHGDTSLANLTGLAPAAPTSGYSGIFTAFFDETGNNNDVTGTVDATFDNFYAAASPPTPAGITAPATPIGMVGAPQVTSHTPASWANFYNAAGGMTINASTLGGPNITYFRLVLNGVDVSAGVTPSPALPSASTTITYNGLVTNTVYDAVVILEDSLNRWTTNVWTFDTFSAAYLADNSKCKNIECEDYDTGGAGLDPLPVPASGYSTNDNTWMTPLGAAGPLDYYAGINIADGPASPYGYVGLPGINDRISPPGDFYQASRTAPLVGQPIVITTLTGDLTSLLPGCEYRTGGAATEWPNFEGNSTGDVVGTERGAAYAISVQNISPANPTLTPQYTFDTKRDKYAALNAAGVAQFVATGNGAQTLYGAAGGNAAPWWDVQEYNVVYTEGGDWFNYTHNWGASQYYGVYLRAACGLSQTAVLYKGMTLDPSSLIGTFHCTNALTWNWRFTPLLDSSGSQAVVKLSGTSTLRLQVAPENPQGVGVFNGLALNYMALVPIAAGSIQVNITPPAAVAEGAQWQLDGGVLRNSGASVDLLAGVHTVSFTPLLHWTTPASQQVTVVAGQTTNPPAAYVPLPVSLWSTTQLKKSGTVWTQETGAIVNSNSPAGGWITNALPSTAKYYKVNWDIPIEITKVSKSGANLVLNYANAVFVTNNAIVAGLNIRAWNGPGNTSGGTIDGAQFNLIGPSPAPNDSTPYDSLYFTNGLGTIGYATQSIDMDGSGPREHFTAADSCGVAAPGPFPVGYSQNYSVEYRGLLYIATAGNYNFQTTSDDGSALWLDAGTDNPTYAQAIVKNNKAQGMTPIASGAQALTVGYHNIIVRYNQGGGGNGLKVYWDPTGGTTFVPIPGSVFFHQAGSIVLTGP
jgi:hypothetical protein